jgi:hypothetical protein
VGIVGAFIPILPTTPFLILSAFLFSKSSPKLHKWILDLPIAGVGIRDWQDNRVIRPRAKVLCTLMIFLSLGIIYVNAKIPILVKTLVTLVILPVWSFVISRKNT